MKSYTMFHCHSDYSLLDSCTKPKDYVELAVRDGAKALSVSEHGKPMNWTEKYAMCKKAGLKYIHSVEIYLTENLTEKVRDNYHTVLMARNIDGLRELNELVSMSCDKEHFYYNNRLSFDEFLNMSDNIISTSACLASPLNKLPCNHPMYTELVRKYDFLEVQPHIHPEQAAFNKRLFALAKKFGKPLIAGTDTHSSTPYKAECRKILTAKRKTYSDEDAFDLTYKTYDELAEMFARQEALTESAYIEAIENTNRLIDMTEEITLDTSIKYPILYGTREKDSEVFSETVEKKFKDKLETGVIPPEQKDAFRNAIDEEMSVFRKLKMDGFMLSMGELISWCKKQGMAIGTARGSVGGSRIAYVTDIIDLNPETWHTVFSRFCNEDRLEIGDIDIDCVESDRPAIFKHITERFGQDKTARVASFGTMQGRKVIEEIGRYLAAKHNDDDGENPWSIPNVARIKKEFDSDPEKTKEKYPEMFYYYDGLLDTKISQSVHPAGMVISPITLPDNFGVFDKDNELCLFLDMDNIHDYTGLAKYDFLVLSTVQVIRDTCRYIGIPYPKTHEINWDDKKVWDDMIKNPAAIFQFEGAYSHDCLKRFKPQNIFDMSLVTACVRPSGASYRDELLARKPHKNPSAMIDELLKDNYGYLIFQEDTIKFLQDICGLSGSEADNIRRAIGRKQRDRLDKAMPSILEGYCNKSTQPREIAKQEAKEFLQILEDSAEYQFGKNHSIAYCLLGYLCAYFRYYYPYEFITAVLNTFSDDAEKTATIVEYAQGLGIKIFPPRWGVSKEIYSFDKERKIIAKDLTSIKFISASLAKELYEVSHMRKYESFPDVLDALKQHTSIDSRQLNILIRLDFFQEIDGNAKRLLRITKLYDELSDRTQFMKEKLDSDMFEIVKAHSRETAKKFVDCDMPAIKQECFKRLSNADISDFSIKEKIADQQEFLGYVDIRTGKPEDVRKVLVTGVFPLKSQRTGNVWAYAFNAVSVGTGKANHWTCKRMVYKTCEFREGDIIYIDKYHKEREQYWHVDSCHRVA